MDFCCLCHMAMALNGSSPARDLCSLCFDQELGSVCPYCDCFDCVCDELYMEYLAALESGIEEITDPDDALPKSRFRMEISSQCSDPVDTIPSGTSPFDPRNR